MQEEGSDVAISKKWKKTHTVLVPAVFWYETSNYLNALYAADQNVLYLPPESYYI